MVRMSQRDGLGSANQARRDRTSGTKGTTGVPAVGQRGGTQGTQLGGLSLGGGRSGVWVCCATLTWFHGRTGGAGRGLGAISKLRAAVRWRQKRWMRVERFCSSHYSPSPLRTRRLTDNALLLKIWVPLAAGPAAETEGKNKGLYHPALLRGKERCSHPSPEEQSNHLRVARLGPLALGFAAPLGGGLTGWDPAYDWLTAPLGWRTVAAVRERGAVAGGSSPSATSRLRCCRRQSGLQQRTAGAGCG